MTPQEAAVADWEAGVTASDVGRKYGVSRSTASGWREKWRREKPFVQSESLKDMELAARRSAIKVHAEDAEPDSYPIQDIWRRAESENARRINQALAGAKFRLSIDTDHPIALAFVSDQHISVGTSVDLKRMREDAEFIAASNDVYAILGGDGIDGHIKHKSAIIGARSTPDDQWRLYEYYLQILAEKVLVAISGNHDHWLSQIGGVDMVRWLAEKNRLRYSPHAAFVELTVGQTAYRICVAHQYRFNSAMNLTHSPKQMLNFGEYDFDIGAVCHQHEHAQESFRRRGLVRWVCRPGSYQIQTDYSAQYGFPLTRPTCPTAVLFPGQRKIVGFDDVRDAVAYLAGIKVERR